MALAAEGPLWVESGPEQHRNLSDFEQGAGDRHVINAKVFRRAISGPHRDQKWGDVASP
jgi:hypothetical protein